MPRPRRQNQGANLRRRTPQQPAVSPDTQRRAPGDGRGSSDFDSGARGRKPGWAAPGVRASATGIATVIVAAALALGAILLVVLVHRSLVGGLDAAGYAQARNVAALGRTGRLQPTIASTGNESSVVQVLDPAGAVVSASGNITGNPAVLASPPGRRVATAFTTSGLPIGDAGQSFRLIAEPVDLPAGPGWVYVATSLGQVDASVSRVATLLAAGLPFLLIVVAVVTWRAVGRALRPVERIRQSAAAIGGTGIGERVPVPSSRDEIARLAVTMNQMLARLQDSAVRQRQFVGDASHELRSPLAALQAQVDVALSHAAPAADSGVLLRVQDQTRRMGLLIDDLLFLARADEHGHRGERTPAVTVDLDELVLAEISRLRRPGGPAVELAVLTAVRTTGSTRDLARMLSNLGDNAAAHAQSVVTFSLVREHEEAVLTVTDDGPGIPQADQARVFDRFVRLDQARARNQPAGGTGLGLAITHQIVQTHGGRVAAADRPDGGHGAAFIIWLPVPSDVGRLDHA